MADLTNISLMTQQQFIDTCHSSVTVPSIILLFISFVVFFLIFGLALVKNSRGKILLILFLTVLCSGVVFLFLFLNPLMTQNMMNWFKSLV
jgi:presenilin-like A22 family membrane protease